MSERELTAMTRNPIGHLDAFGPLVLLMTELTADREGYCIAHSIFPSGVFVPVHSHEDRETFYIISGELENWDGTRWRTLHAGDVLDVLGHQPHAFRNVSGKDVTAIFVTTGKMGRFFREIMRQPTDAPPGPPTPELLVRLAEVAGRHGYWMGSPEENATAGIG